jgi:lysophospholipase L1-like esterase
MQVSSADQPVTYLPRTARKLRERQPLRIVAFGDSISEVGRSATWHGGAGKPESNWAQQLGVLLRRDYPTSQIEVVNAGIGGQNSYEGLGRIDVLESLKPDLVLIEFGANDCCFHFLQPEETELALTTLANGAKLRLGADVMLLGTAGDNPKEPFFERLDETLAATRRAAGAAGVPYIDLRTPVLAATENGARWNQYHLASGNCHPNDAGHRLWAQTVHAALRQEIQ